MYIRFLIISSLIALLAGCSGKAKHPVISVWEHDLQSGVELWSEPDIKGTNIFIRCPHHDCKVIWLEGGPKENGGKR